MFDAFGEFSTALSGNYPVLWALLVMVVVTVVSLGLFLFWELFFRLLPIVSPISRGRKER